jgi:hypothetical protein
VNGDDNGNGDDSDSSNKKQTNKHTNKLSILKLARTKKSYIKKI